MEPILAPGSTADESADRWYSIQEIPKQPQWRCLNRWQLYDAVASGKLRAARIGIGRRRLVVKGAWVNSWLEAAATPVPIDRAELRAVGR